jgi:methionine-rich copper-binding protein CopC
MLVKKVFFSLVALFVFIHTGASTAFAHAQLITTYPMANSELESLPSRITLEFGEEMLDFSDGNQIKVINPEGEEISSGATLLNGAMVYREISTNAIPGIYKVNYRAISNDGHKVSGEFTFSVASRNKSDNSSIKRASSTPSASPSQSHAEVFQKAKDKFPANHFWHTHAQHIFLTLLVLSAIAAWAVYRKFN